MPTIKDALDIIGKLTVAEQESLKTAKCRDLSNRPAVPLVA